MKKEIMVIKDCKLIGIANTLEIQWSKRSVDENDKILDKENVRGTIDLDMAQIEGSDASERLKVFLPELAIEQAKQLGDLQAQINAISKECAIKVSIAQKESSDKLVALTRADTYKEELKSASEVCDSLNDEINKIGAINKEIYAENQALKAINEMLIKNAVILDENIANLSAQILLLKKDK